jgi:hypothetical protein
MLSSVSAANLMTDFHRRASLQILQALALVVHVLNNASEKSAIKKSRL